MTFDNDKLKQLDRSLDRLNPVFDALSKKYGDEGAGIIMGTKMMIQVLLPGNLSVDEVVRLADKIALFNGVKPL